MVDIYIYIYREGPEQEQLPPITGEALREACAEGSDSAAGMDAWAPADFKLLSGTAYEELARFLKMIADGAEWPEDLLNARAAYMEKGDDDPNNPLAYTVYC